MKQAGVLALDLATTTGWAWHLPGMPRPIWSSLRMPGTAEEYGARGNALEVFLRQQYLLAKPKGGFSHFVFEAVNPVSNRRGPGGKTISLDPRTLNLLIGLSMIVEKFAFQVGARCYRAEPQSWRKHFIGRGAGFGKLGLDPKQMAVEECHRLGWMTDQRDEAEALGILDYALSELPDYPRPWRDNSLMTGMR